MQFHIRAVSAVLSLGGLLGFGQASFAQEPHPTVGIVHNTKEANSLQYRCELEGSQLKCDFTQASVRRQSSPKEIAAAISKARSEFRGGKAQLPDAATCKQMTELRDVIEGRKPVSQSTLITDVKRFQETTEAERKRGLPNLHAILRFCEAKTEADYMEVARLSEEDKLRTCGVSTHTFSQTFRLIKDAGSGKGVWAVQAPPSGPCGVVQLSRFEVEDRLYWKYIARKAITNPNGQLMPAIGGGPPTMCKNLDEAEYLYDWRSKDHIMGCEYIVFSVF